MPTVQKGTFLKKDEDVLCEAGRWQDFRDVWQDAPVAINANAQSIVDFAIELRDQIIEKENLQAEFDNLSLNEQIGAKGRDIANQINSINDNLGLDKEIDWADQHDGRE